jgi:hypothetical protein
MSSLEIARAAVIAKLAYELARSGRSADFPAVERELIDLGFGADIHLLLKPGVREAVGSMCAASRREPHSERREVFL